MPKGKKKVKADYIPPVKPVKVEKKFTPKPDMGDIKEPPKAIKSCVHCNHLGDKHYGGPMGWCNTPNCECPSFHE